MKDVTGYLRKPYGLYVRFAQRLDDIASFGHVRRFLPEASYFPVTSSSLGLHALHTVINDVVINRRYRVLELGSGLSTLALSAVRRQLDLPLTVVSIEHDPGFAEFLGSGPEADGARIVGVPLGADRFYDRTRLAEALEGEQFDLLLVDGPPENRAPALEVLSPYLDRQRCSVYLDDVHFPSFAGVLDEWSHRFGADFRRISQTVAMATRGTAFNPVP